MNPQKNPIGLDGIEFIEFASPDPEAMHRIFTEFGFSRTMHHHELNIDYYNQGDIHLLLNREPGSHAAGFTRAHGPCVSSMGWRVRDAGAAVEAAIARGARGAVEADYVSESGERLPAIFGIGDSLIYFVEPEEGVYKAMGFEPHPDPVKVKPKGFEVIDHLTNNVEKGTMATWANFYKDIFGFTEVRYFDIRGSKTGLISYALRSPCGRFCIPINEGTEHESQINEYLREYNGPGVQHIAFLTKDIIRSVEAMVSTSVETLDIDADYYEEVWKRVPNVKEDHQRIEKLQILADGDENGYLLQIFTRNLFGPVFIEIIQRENNNAFGEGNFGALFRSIERDQEKRGVI